MSPRTGRPKAENPKGINLTVRLDAETAEALMDYCKKHGTKRADAVRCGIQMLLANK